MYGILMVEGHNLQELNVKNVVEIKLDNETDIEVIRKYVYERERNRTRESLAIANYFEEGLVKEHRLGDFDDYQELTRKRQDSQENSGTYRGNRNGRRTSYVFEEEVSDDDLKFG